jgi:HK97 family phage major capsid protein
MMPQPVPRPEPSGFASLGEQLRAVARIEYSGGRSVDPRLDKLQKRAAAAGASEMVPSDGGWLVAPEFSREIVERAYQTGQVLQRCMVVPTTSNRFQFPQFDEGSRVAGSRLGGIEAYWENESASLLPSALTVTTQKPGFNRASITPNKITGILYLTDELSVDSDAFDTWAPYAFGQELTFKLEAAIINGTGAGQPMGVMNSPALITVPIVPGQQSGTVVSANINAMLAAFWAMSYESPSALWIYNQALLPQLSTLATLVGTAGSESKLWQWCTSDDNYDRLAGFPAISSEHCKFTGTPGDIMLADFSRYIVAMRERFRSEVSIHVLFLSDQNAFRFICRAGGQPIDRSPVTALNGGSPPYQTSPFVALAQR